MNVQVRLPGTEHWTSKGEVKLFLWNKVAGDPAKTKGTILFVHGSSMASQPTFDLDVPGRPDSSAMEYFAKQGYDCWCVDMEGYGRSTKDRDNNAPISFGADDCFAAATYIQKLRGPPPSPRLRHLVGRAARRRCSPSAIPRWSIASRSTRRCGPAKARRRLPSGARSCPSSQSKNRRPIDRAFVHSIFNRDHPGTAEERVIDAFADAIVKLDDSVPTGTYVDMCSKLPVNNPENIKVPTLIMRGQWDGIAGFDDLIEFFKRLPNPDKQFAVMPGISHASFQQKNYLLVLPHPAELLFAAEADLSGITDRPVSAVCQPKLPSSKGWRERRDSNPRPPA